MAHTYHETNDFWAISGFNLTHKGFPVIITIFALNSQRMDIPLFEVAHGLFSGSQHTNWTTHLCGLWPRFRFASSTATMSSLALSPLNSFYLLQMSLFGFINSFIIRFH